MKQQSNGTSSLDYGAFYSQIDKADDGLDEVSRDLRRIFRDTDHLSFMFENLASKAEKIEDEEKREKFTSELMYLEDRLYEIGEQCYAISAEIDRVREYNLSELLVEGEELAEEVKKHEGFLRST